MSSALSVGTPVRIPFGGGRVLGEIAEDRGLIGVQGRRLYRILILVEPDEPISFEIPEDELELVVDRSSAHEEPDQSAVVNYLKHGGLTSILRANLTGGRNQPRVWLCKDQLGHITHTFVQERGQLGGATIPFMAVEGRRIFLPKRAEVLAFLSTFGLNQQQAEDVVTSVGTYPR